MEKIHKLTFPTKQDWEDFKKTIQDQNGNWIDGIVTVIEGGHLPKLLTEPIVDENGNEQWYGTYDDYAVDIVTLPDFDNSIFKDHYISVDKPLMGIDGEYEVVDKF